MCRYTVLLGRYLHRYYSNFKLRFLIIYYFTSLFLETPIREGGMNMKKINFRQRFGGEEEITLSYVYE